MVAHEVHTLETWFDSNVRNQVATKYVVVLYTDLLFQLPPTLTLSTHLCGTSSGYEVCGYAAKDHLKINEGEGKEICEHSLIG